MLKPDKEVLENKEKLVEWIKSNPDGILDLGGADLGGANLSGADLGGADLGGADLGGANLSGANLSGADLSYADLSGANLSYANLSGANLSGANLSGADLGGANLSDADLSGANLSYADLSYADLSDANLSDANLSGANLGGADLSYAKNVFSVQEFIKNHFEYNKTGLIVFKAFGKETPNNSNKWGKPKKNKIITEVCNPVVTNDCGCGVNCATLEWIEKQGWSNVEVWKCVILYKDLPGLVVPWNSNGKIRCNRLKLIKQVKK